MWSIWGNGGEDGLLRAFDDEGLQQEHRVDTVGDTSLTADAVQTPDGATWVSVGYTLTRVHEGTATTWHLPLEVEGQLPGAADRGAPLAGTWISALAVRDDNSVYVARLNVARLTSVGPDGGLHPDVEVPEAYHGSRAMGRVGEDLYLCPGWLADASTPLATVVSGKVRQGDLPGVMDLDGAFALTHAGAFQLPAMRSTNWHGPDPVSALLRHSTTGALAWWDQAANSIVHSEHGTLPLATNTGVGSAPWDGVSRQPTDGVTQVGETIVDLRFDAQQRLWMLRDNGHTLMVW